jgi:hypothetical protein
MTTKWRNPMLGLALEYNRGYGGKYELRII